MFIYICQTVTQGVGSTHSLNLTFVMYGVKNSREKSGAYLFLPDGEAKVSRGNALPLFKLFREET